MNDLLRFAHVGACFGHPPSFAWKWWISRRRQGQVFTPIAFPGLTMFSVQTNLFAFDRLLDQLLSQNKFGRARAILAGCKGGSVGSYSDSPGIEVKALRSGWKDKDQNYCEFCLSRFGWKDNTIPRQRSKSLFPVKHQCLCFQVIRRHVAEYIELRDGMPSGYAGWFCFIIWWFDNYFYSYVARTILVHQSWDDYIYYADFPLLRLEEHHLVCRRQWGRDFFFYGKRLIFSWTTKELQLLSSSKFSSRAFVAAWS